MFLSRLQNGCAEPHQVPVCDRSLCSQPWLPLVQSCSLHLVKGSGKGWRKERCSLKVDLVDMNLQVLTQIPSSSDDTGNTQPKMSPLFSSWVPTNSPADASQVAQKPPSSSLVKVWCLPHGGKSPYSTAFFMSLLSCLSSPRQFRLVRLVDPHPAFNVMWVEYKLISWHGLSLIHAQWIF